MRARLILFAAMLSPLLLAQDQEVGKYLEEIRTQRIQQDAARRQADAEAERKRLLATWQQQLERLTEPKALARVYLLIGSGYQAIGDPDSAIAAARKAKELMPEDQEIALGVARILAAGGQTAEMAHLLGVDPTDGAALIRRGSEFLDGLGDNSQLAAACAELALKLTPDDPTVANSAAWIYLRAHRLDNAILVFNTLEAKAPQAALYHYGLTLAFRQKGYQDYARDELAKALQGDAPDESQMDQLLHALSAEKQTIGELAVLLGVKPLQ